MIAVGTSHGTDQDRASVAAAEVQDYRRIPSEYAPPVERATGGQPAQGGLRPLLVGQYAAGERHAKLLFFVMHVHIGAGSPAQLRLREEQMNRASAQFSRLARSSYSAGQEKFNEP